MKDVSGQQPDKLETVLESLLLRKSEAAEYVVVGDEKLLVTRESCPSVLQSANQHNPEILLVQQYSQQNRKLLSVKSSSESSSIQTSNSPNRAVGDTPVKAESPNVDLDITGSPLKCPFMQEKYETNFSPFTIPLPECTIKGEYLPYTPVSSHKAEFIASKFNLTMKKMTSYINDVIPVWVACDGLDNQGKVFLGLHHGGGSFTRTLVTSSEVYEGRESLPSLDLITVHHAAIGPTKGLENTVEATYSVLTSEGEDKGSSLNLTCKWKRPLTMLSPPAPDSQTIANVKVVCNDIRSAVYMMHHELSMLKGFIASLRSGEVAWFIRDGRTSVAEELHSLFLAMKEEGYRQKREDGNGFDMMMAENMLIRQQNLDFTDSLWSILMKSESFQELKDNLDLVFQAIESKQVRPQIHIRNCTQIGTKLRNIMRGKEGAPELSSLTPFHMLIEIGCEKIKRDYIYFFQNGDLATSEQLSPFLENMGGNGIEAWEATLKELERLHVALQVVATLRTHLNLPSPLLSHFNAQVLKEMKDEDPGFSHSFSLKLDTLSVYELLKSMKINTWEVNFGYSEGPFSQSLLCHVSRTPLIRFISSLENDELENIEENCDDTNMDNDQEDQYYCTFFTTISDTCIV